MRLFGKNLDLVLSLEGSGFRREIQETPIPAAAGELWTPVIWSPDFSDGGRVDLFSASYSQRGNGLRW
jgi:hypothetical protein